MAFPRTRSGPILLKGLRLNGFHSFKSLFLYSTSSSSVKNGLLVEFLVKSVGFSKAEALSITTKVRSPLPSPKKSQVVVGFFKDRGFDDTHIRKLLYSCPNVLFNSVEKTLKPKIRVFQNLGLSGSDLGLIISRYPSVLYRSLNDHIVPSLKILSSLVGSNEQLVRVLLKSKSQQLLNCNVLKSVPDNLLLLQSYGIGSERIKVLMLQRPLFVFRRTPWVEKILKGVEEKLGIPRTSGMFLHGIYALSRKREDKIESWFQVFHGYGWSKAEISDSLRRQPVVLSLSKEQVSAKLKYYMEDLGYRSDLLAKRPILLSFSMEKRIVPRAAVMRVLKEKQMVERDVCFLNVVCMAESKFVEKYVRPFEDKLPELYEYYSKTTGRVALYL